MSCQLLAEAHVLVTMVMHVRKDDFQFFIITVDITQKTMLDSDASPEHWS